jgi:hypothetical protein
MKRKEVKSKTIKQDNDASCFYHDSKHNKRAKRLSSKRLRKLVKDDTQGQSP